MAKRTTERIWTLHHEPHRHYRCNGSWNGANKQRIASVTQVLDGDFDRLVDWAGAQSLVAGEWVAQHMLGAAPDLARSILSFGQMAALSGLLPDQVRDGKADSGTAVHEYFYRAVAGATAGAWPTADAAPYGLKLAVDQFVADFGPQAYAVEKIVGSYNKAIAGTYDFHGELNTGRVYRLDVKQSNTVQPKHFAQLAAYEELGRECGEQPSDVLMVLHLQPAGTYDVYTIRCGSDEHGWAAEYWTAARYQYRNHRSLEKVIKRQRPKL